jgi:hypothetical protein
MSKMTPTEMFTELVRMGYATPATIEPSRWMVPTAYVSVPTSLAFFTPPISLPSSKDIKNAKLGSRPKRDSKRKRRPRR